MEELPGAPVGTDRSRVALGRSKKQMPGQKDRTFGGRRDPRVVLIKKIGVEKVDMFGNRSIDQAKRSGTVRSFRRNGIGDFVTNSRVQSQLTELGGWTGHVCGPALCVLPAKVCFAHPERPA